MDAVGLTQEMLSNGYQIRLPGTFVLRGNVYFSPPKPPTTENWAEFSFFEGSLKPCGISVAADDVTLDLGGFSLSGCSEATQGLVLVHVLPGVRNFTLLRGSLQLCFAAVLVDSFCAATTLQGLFVSNFEQKGVVAYSPQGITIENCVVGPNLSELRYASQETRDLVSYGPFVKARDLYAWANSSDDPKVVETSHLVGIDIAPDALRDSPFPPDDNTGADVVITNVQVQQLTMHVREHSILASIGLRTGEPLFAYGLRGERLPEWYALRRGAPFRDIGGSVPYQPGFYPSLAAPLDPWELFADYPMNAATGELYEPRKTVWVRGVDRVGVALRGAQGVLIAGVPPSSITFSNVSVQEPVVKTLPARVLLPAPKGIEARDLTVTTKASKIVVVPAAGFLNQTRAPSSCCTASSTPGKLLAGLFEMRASNVSSRAGYPPGNVAPTHRGGVFGVSAAAEPVGGCFSAT